MRTIFILLAALALLVAGCNNSVGGGYGGEIGEDIFPTRLVIGYVRVFEYVGK